MKRTESRPSAAPTHNVISGSVDASLAADGLLDRWVNETPDSVAAVALDGELTYRELDTLANQLAHHLRRRGCGPGGRVGVSAEPSLTLLVAIFGILKAGAAYVPIDADYPSERLRYLFQDAALNAVVSDRANTDRLPSTGCEILELGSNFALLANEPTTPPARAISVDAAACVIYSSGSTGSPKGILVTHRGLVNLAEAAVDEFGLRPGDRFLQLSSISFSAVLEEIFPPLLAGGTVVLAGYRQALQSVSGFLALLRHHHIAGFEITAAYWHQVVDELIDSSTAMPPTVRFVVVGGDRLRPDQVLRWRGLNVPLIHVYGPTEATATGSYHHSSKEDPDPDGHVSIGRAIQNVRLHLLDASGVSVATGEVGEIHIGGDTLAHGYLGAPGSTADKFVPDRFGEPGGRLYCTGDVGRQLPDGTIEFLGRLDDQIKLRGFRIEPAEIEIALQRHRDVRQAIVVSVNSKLEDQHLVAYVDCNAEATVNDAALRQHLGEILPQHMVPAIYVQIDGLPLTPNGKIDRAALKESASETTWRNANSSAPNTGIESEVATIWAAVLKLDAVGRTDDFFALGGNSLQAMLIVSKARRHFALELRPKDLLSEPTVAAFASRIEHLRVDQATDPYEENDEAEMQRWREKREMVEKAILANGGEARMSPISVSQQNLWFISKLVPDLPLYNEAWQCRLSGKLDIDAFRRALDHIVARHETFRSRFAMIDGQPVQVVEDQCDFPLKVGTLAGGTPAERLRQAYQIRDRVVVDPISTTQSPLARGWLFEVAEDDHLLVLCMHHLVWDAVSKDVFLDEVMELYRAALTDTAPTLPPLPLQFGDYALWQRSLLAGPEFGRLADYWQDRLAGTPTVLAIPSDRPAPTIQDFAGDRVSLRLPPDLRSRVVEVARREDVSPFMVLFTAQLAQLYRMSGESALCVGTPVSNRNRAGIENLMGCFINSVPLRVDVDDRLSYRGVLDKVRTTVIEALDHQDLPLDKIVEVVKPTRQPGRNPLFQVWFAIEDEARLRRESPDLTIDHFDDLTTDLSTGMAKLDLSWFIVDRGDHYLLSLSYRTGMFDEQTVVGLAQEYQSVLEALLDNLDSLFATTDSDQRPDGAPNIALISEQLLDLWQRAFDVDDFDIDADFFELGGYSMLAVEIVTGIQEEFGVDVSFTDFFESPTVRQVAQIIADSGVGVRSAPAVRSQAERTLDEILAEIDKVPN